MQKCNFKARFQGWYGLLLEMEKKVLSGELGLIRFDPPLSLVFLLLFNHPCI